MTGKGIRALSTFRHSSVRVRAAQPRGGLCELAFDQNLTAGSFRYYSAGSLPATDLTATSALLHGTIAVGNAILPGR